MNFGPQCSLVKVTCLEIQTSNIGVSINQQEPRLHIFIDVLIHRCLHRPLKQSKMTHNSSEFCFLLEYNYNFYTNLCSSFQFPSWLEYMLSFSNYEGPLSSVEGLEYDFPTTRSMELCWVVAAWFSNYEVHAVLLSGWSLILQPRGPWSSVKWLELDSQPRGPWRGWCMILQSRRSTEFCWVVAA